MNTPAVLEGRLTDSQRKTLFHAHDNWTEARQAADDARAELAAIIRSILSEEGTSLRGVARELRVSPNAIVSLLKRTE